MHSALTIIEARLLPLRLLHKRLHVICEGANGDRQETHSQTYEVPTQVADR